MEATSLAAAAWITHGDQTRLLQKQPLNAFADPGQVPTIAVDTSVRHQIIDGFGFALTGGSAELIAGLPSGQRAALLDELFSPAGNGIGISRLRISIGASDLSRKSFSYADCAPGQTDPELARFDIKAGDIHVIPLLWEILAVNPALKILATPWSAPPWMKTNGSFVSGSLKRKHFPAYARYLVLYIQRMRSLGIPISAITPQNEPLNIKNEPSMRMGAKAQADFIADHLGPALRAAGLSDVALFCYDHNCDRPDYPLAVVANPRARQFIAGVAWHLYRGTPAALSRVGKRHPDLRMYLTEQWVGADGQFGNDLIWHVRNVLIGTLRNGAHAVHEWNLAGDPAHGPHTPGGSDQCVGALTIDGAGTITRNVSYYVIAHLARFVPPGSVRIDSTAAETLPNVAFTTPRGEVVLLVLNDSAATQSFAITCKGRRLSAALAAGAVGTYVWPSAASAASV